ncbi:MAG TPA: zinc-binding dehydrogenase, partial [Chthoniobacterales bacterium]|nr:zinc-binding dehydrogenase [Chthoniobacterales bacterium]
GGLGISAIQLARHLGAAKVFAVDINAQKLGLAARFGAVPVDATAGDPVARLRDLTNGSGVDVALELVGLAVTMRQAVQSLGVLGRAALVGLTQERFEVAPYLELLNKEAEIIGVSDHLASELPVLLDFVQTRKLDLSGNLIRSIPLDAAAVNDALDRLEKFGGGVRTVIVA